MDSKQESPGAGESSSTPKPLVSQGTDLIGFSIQALRKTSAQSFTDEFQGDVLCALHALFAMTSRCNIAISSKGREVC